MSKSTGNAAFTALPIPSPWPGANARLLGVGAGLPVSKLDRLAALDDKEFERLVLEWGNDYLKTKVPGVFEVQLRGGAGDKGRDVVVWFDPPGSPSRRWHLYQCKHYASALGTGPAFEEIGKVIHYTNTGSYTAPEEYWFVTHKGVTSPLQDLLDHPAAMRDELLKNWDTHCRSKITSTTAIELTDDLRAHIDSFDFGIFRAKQPLDLIAEHEQTRYHLTVFGAALIERPPTKAPPSTVAPQEAGYIAQLLNAFSHQLGENVTDIASVANNTHLKRLFDRSRLTFYSAEGLKELARDQMADAAYFDTLLEEFYDGLFHYHTDPQIIGLDRIVSTVKASQSLQLSAHVLAPHVVPNDREGMCHQMANEQRVDWCAP